MILNIFGDFVEVCEVLDKVEKYMYEVEVLMKKILLLYEDFYMIFFE